jgi:hypothetical protein
MTPERWTIAVGEGPESRGEGEPKGAKDDTRWTDELQGADGGGAGHGSAPRPGTLTFSISEAATALGVSDDLVYELVERKDLPWSASVVEEYPSPSLDLILDQALSGFDPDVLGSAQ